jgi:hypothetical protein
MEMRAETTTMILVRMAEHKNVHVKPALSVVLKLSSQCCYNIWGWIARVVRSSANVHVDEKSSAAFKFDERHVPVADREKGNNSRHTDLIPFFRPSAVLAPEGYVYTCMAIA